MKLIIGFVLVISSLFSQVISPVATIESGGYVADIVLKNDDIIVGTSAGTVEVYDYASRKLKSKFEFEKIKDFMGDEISPKVFSVDYLNGAYLAVVQSSNGARRLFKIENGKKNELISDKEGLFISKAKFIDKNRVIYALLGNDIVLFDIAKKKEIYHLHVNYSHFSDFKLNEDKSLLASSCESGEISIINVEKGTIYKVLKGANVDNVYKVDFKNDKVLAAGQDRRGIVYDVDMGSYDRFDADFLIYAGALSPKAKKAAFAFTEDNDIVIFDLFRKKRVFTLRGQKSTLNTIVFKNEKELISGSDDKFIMIWRLP
ncbi:WD40 repeat domain-containing protein [Sulfurospirillum sp. 1307]|jgi:WD40 repeat protein